MDQSERASTSRGTTVTRVPLSAYTL